MVNVVSSLVLTTGIAVQDEKVLEIQRASAGEEKFLGRGGERE